MVSQRQRLARKRYKEENPELFPRPEPSQPKDPTKVKKTRSGKFKRMKSKVNVPNKPKKASYKHPLRVAGKRPGESCYICRGQDHIAKDCPKKSEWERHKVCLLCRNLGHSMKNCPNKTNESNGQKLCYNCGETGHSLNKCRQPFQDGGTKYANCFVCNESGHLSKNCPRNTRGIYPKGGSCKICGGITHLANDCPNKQRRTSNSARAVGQSAKFQERPNRITRLVGGDDLEDDFTTILEAKGESVKPKSKVGTKIVNFVG